MLQNGVFAQGEKGVTVKNTAQSDAIGNTWAIIVGVSDYQNIAKLNFADKDADAFYTYLRSPQLNIPETNIKKLLNKEATATNIFGALDWLTESVKENDRVFFYFSGHGDVEKRTIHQNGFLLASDAPAAAYMSKGTISIKFLQDYLETYIGINKAKQVLLIVDACRSGKLAGGSEGIQVTMQALGKPWAGQITKILSAQEGELSLEDPKWGGGRGVFSYYLMKGIQGLANRNSDNVITTAELAAYLPLAVADETNNNQNPKIEGDAKNVLFKFDEAMLAEAKKPDFATGPMLAANKKGIADELKPAITDAFEKYNELVKKGWLLWGSTEKDTLNSALHYYKTLINNPDAASIKPSLKSSFLAALQRNSQNSLDDYLKGINSEKIKEPRGIKEIIYASNLVEKTHILYNYIKARALFFESIVEKNHLKAVGILKQALALEEDAPYVLNRIGLRYADANLSDSAIYYYQKALALAPTWSFPYNNLGIQYWENKVYDKAIENCLKSITYAPNNGSPYNVLGHVYEETGKYELAKTNYFKSIALDPKSSYPYNGLGNVFYDVADYENAKHYYELAIQTDSTDSDPHVGLGNVYSATDFKLKDYTKAIYYYQKAIALDTADAIAPKNLASVYIAKRDYKAAEQMLKLSVAKNPKFAEAYDEYGNLYDSKSDYENALKYFKKAIIANPKYIYAWHNVGYIFNKMGKTDSAIFYFKKSIVLDPTEDYPYKRLARIYLSKGDTSKAIFYYKGTLKYNPDGETYHDVGHLYTDSVKMYAHFYKAAELNNDDAINHLTSQLNEQKSFLKPALKFYTDSLAAEHKNEQLYVLIGKTYLLNNDNQAALKSFLMAIDAEPKPETQQNFVQANTNETLFTGTELSKQIVLSLIEALAANNKLDESLTYLAVALANNYYSYQTVIDLKESSKLQSSPKFKALLVKYFPDAAQ